MKKIISISLSATLVYAAITILLVRCSSRPLDEGVIEFDISYPNFNGTSFMQKMLPTRMTMKFKDGKFRTIITKGKTIRMDFISDCVKKTMISAFQMGSKKIAVNMNEKEIKAVLSEFPEVVYIDIPGTDTLAGMTCHMKAAVFEDISFPECELWYTDEINLPNANWCYPFSHIKGVLLKYDVERYGMRMRLCARRVLDESVDDAEFEVPAGYKNVMLKDFEEEIKRFTMLVNN